MHERSQRTDDTAYEQWSVDRLVEDYRRNSERLRSEGPSLELLERLCAVEERLRARGVDVDEVVRDLY
jgi:hypothetical protein